MSTRKRQPFVDFAEQTLGLSFTPAWRVLVKVTIDGVQPSSLEGDERELARRLLGDVEDIDPALRRVVAWRLGRASGKTTVASAINVWAAWTAALRSGRGHIATGFVVAPTKPLAKIGTVVSRELVRGTSLDRYVEDDLADGFTMRRPDGRLVAIRSVAASRGGANLRGVDVIALVLDEAEFFASSEDGAEGYAIQDRDQVSAVMPRLLEFVLFSGTPWPTENMMGELVDRNWGRPQDAVAALGPSMFMRPTKQLEIDRAHELARDEENALREYDCVVGVRGGSRLFDVESIRAAIVEDRPLVITAGPGMHVGAGGDVAFERDSSAIAICGRDAEKVVDLLEFDEIRPSRGAPLSPAYVIRERFAPLMRKHGVHTLWSDAHYRQSVVEHLFAADLVMADAPTGQQGKYDTYMHLRELLRAGRLRLPNSPKLIAQLRAVTSTPLPLKGTKITSPRRAGSGHGDLVSALVLGCWAVRVDVIMATHAERRREQLLWAAAGLAQYEGDDEPLLRLQQEQMRKATRATMGNAAWVKKAAEEPLPRNQRMSWPQLPIKGIPFP